MNKNIITVGYYNHNNIGDEQYKITFKKLFGDSYNVTYIDCDKFKKEDIKENDIIVFGGGDIILEYFIDRFLKVVKDIKNKIYAVSVGVPYPSYIYKQDLSFFEHIYVRSFNDYKLLSKYYNNVTLIPDISILLKDVVINCLKIKTFKKIIGITAIQECNIEEIIKIIENYPESEYFYAFIPFNTNKLNLKENDNMMHDKIIKYMTENMRLMSNNYINFSEVVDPLEIFGIIGQLNVYITARYHGCQFAKHNNVKFIPVYNSQKIKNFVKNLENVENLNVIKFRENFESASDRTNSVDTYVNNLKKRLFKKEILTENDKNIVVKACSYLLTGKIESEYNYGLREKIFNKDTDFNAEIKWILNDIDENIYKREEESENEDKNKKPKNVPKNVKTREETLKKNIRDIKHDEFMKKNNGTYFDIYFKNQNDDSGTHRSGWKYVYDNISKFASEGKDILLDMYIDETFHWSSDVYQFLEIIPYRKKWVGFIHHTFNTSFTEYNCTNLLKNNLFLESLKCCKCIIVLSEYLKQQMMKELAKIGIFVNIHVLYHPTELDVPSFDYNKFIENKDSKILNIGSWYRNIYSFYSLNFVISYRSSGMIGMCTRASYVKGGTCNLSKTILTGKKSCNYFPNKDFLSDFKNFLCGNENKENPRNDKCCGTIKNNWNVDFYDDIESKIKSVKIISHLHNDEYDDILTQNIVFCNLVDASAVNTLIECVARNTPIIISKLPAVVELLGDNYPLYIDNLNIIENTMYIPLDLIKRAHHMLCATDKYVISIENFIENLLKIINK